MCSLHLLWYFYVIWLVLVDSYCGRKKTGQNSMYRKSYANNFKNKISIKRGLNLRQVRVRVTLTPEQLHMLRKLHM